MSLENTSIPSDFDWDGFAEFLELPYEEVLVMINNAKQEGYDGIIAHKTGEGRGNKKGDTYIVFNENQLIDANNDNIKYSIDTKNNSTTDSQGRKVDFRNTVIIMTSNLGARQITERKSLGFAAGNDDAERDYNKVMERK